MKFLTDLCRNFKRYIFDRACIKSAIETKTKDLPKEVKDKYAQEFREFSAQQKAFPKIAATYSKNILFNPFTWLAAGCGIGYFFNSNSNTATPWGGIARSLAIASAFTAAQKTNIDIKNSLQAYDKEHNPEMILSDVQGILDAKFYKQENN